MFALTVLGTVAKPGIFFVAHVTFFGPVVLLAAFLWRPVCRLVNEHGTGLTLAVLGGFVLSLNGQSRYFTNLFPFLVPFVVKAVEPLGWRPAHHVLFAALALLSSKVWMTFNCGPFHGRLFEFPDQYLFMSIGQWMSDTTYVIQGAAILAGGAVLWAFVPLRTQSARAGGARTALQAA
jgi:hypothetical protein